MPLYLGNTMIVGETRPFDSEPVEGSTNAIESGAVYKALEDYKTASLDGILLKEKNESGEETGNIYILEIINGSLTSTEVKFI